MTRTSAASAYSRHGDTWAADASLAYRPLAHHLIDRCPTRLTDARVLDAGAGTGIAGEILRQRGARAVAIDLEFDMLRRAASGGPAVAGDVTALPFADRSFDACVAAFVVNHLDDPAAGLHEMRRVTRWGGSIVASAFSTSRPSAKAAVDEVAARYGYTPPDWYTQLQQRAAGVGTVERMTAAAETAGLTVVRVFDDDVDLGLDRPELVVRYRLGLPHLSRFVASLEPSRRASLVAEAVEAVAADGEAFVPTVIELVATVA